MKNEAKKAMDKIKESSRSESEPPPQRNQNENKRLRTIEEMDIKLEASRQETVRWKETAREQEREVERLKRQQEAARQEAAIQLEAARQEAARQEAARQEAAIQLEAAIQEAARQQEQEENKRQAHIARQVKEKKGIFHTIKVGYAKLKGNNNIDISYNVLFNSLSSFVTSHDVYKKGLQINIQTRLANLGVKWFFFFLNNCFAKLACYIFNWSNQVFMYTAPMVESVLVYLHQAYIPEELKIQSFWSNVIGLANTKFKKLFDYLTGIEYISSLGFAAAIATSTSCCKEQSNDLADGGYPAAVIGTLIPEVIGITFYYLVRKSTRKSWLSSQENGSSILNNNPQIVEPESITIVNSDSTNNKDKKYK